MNMTGTLYYVLQNSRTKISYKHIKMYHVLENHVEKYLTLYRDYTAYKRTRTLLLYYLS